MRKYKKFDWLNEDSRTFLSRGYLTDNEKPEDRIRDIADKAEWYLKDMATTKARKSKYDGFADKFYDYMSKGYYSLASPIWANYGNDRGLPVSCFGSFIDDSMQAILFGHAENGMLMKNGGGTSGYFGAVRGRGAPIRDSGDSSGSVHFMQMYDTLKRIQMGFRRPQKDDGSTSKHIEHFEGKLIKEFGPFSDKCFTIPQNSKTKMIRIDHI